MIKRFFQWFFGFDPIIEELEGVDDAHDSIDPQMVTRVYGNAVEMGDWKP